MTREQERGGGEELKDSFAISLGNFPPYLQTESGYSSRSETALTKRLEIQTTLLSLRADFQQQRAELEKDKLDAGNGSALAISAAAP